MKTLALTLKMLREKKGLSMEQLAEKAKVSKGIIGEIERDKTRSTVKTLNKIANALELTIAEKNDLDNAFLQKNTSDINVLNIGDPIKMMVIPVFSSVAAGMGYIPDAEPIDFISIPEVGGECIGIRVAGDSMEPTFYNNDIVVIKKDIEVGLGEVGVFLNKHSGESWVKRLKKKNGVYVLESDNHMFKDKEIKSDEICCCGKVINVVKKDLKKRVNPLLEKIEMLDPKQQEILEMMINGLLDKK
ncbi:LexA family transcriptional regulator [Cetobacterium sp. ZOR0034]|uniref:XRE family transcriptional regulator n=1 Tax=Cetobacterium sp. ZOR0034 TaxID=1339239 RepID=UPI00068A59C7|nr:LexA family transcriptional regulator [Cetobacterium sp. ZOR0034]